MFFPAVKKVKLSSGEQTASQKSHFFRKSATKASRFTTSSQESSEEVNQSSVDASAVTQSRLETLNLDSEPNNNSCDGGSDLNLDFKFNFKITAEDITSTGQTFTEDIGNNSDSSSVPINFMPFQKSANDFRFNFAVD